MTKVSTYVMQIADKEEFNIIVMQNGLPIDTTKNGVLGPYPYQRKAKGSMTFKEWLADRFKKTYPGFTCKVQNGTGEEVPGHMLLSTLREHTKRNNGTNPPPFVMAGLDPAIQQKMSLPPRGRAATGWPP